jgi:hypothetical protein
MSPFDAASLTVSICALVGLGVSLAYLHRQGVAMREQSAASISSVRLSIWGGFQQAFSQMNDVFYRYPLLRDVFYEDESDSDDPSSQLDENDLRRARSAAETLLDIMDMSILMREVDSSRNKLPADWFHPFVVHSFENSRFLCEVLILRQDWYHEELYDLAVSSLARRASK